MNSPIGNFQILALNDAEQSENRIHSDDIAVQYGFDAALVSGVNVFGYLTQPLVRRYGAAWLERGVLDVLFIKPSYQDKLLTIVTEDLGEQSGQRSHLTTAFNEQQVPVARLESWLPAKLSPPDAWAAMPNGTPTNTRPEISWDAIKLEQAAPYFQWLPTREENDEHVRVQRDQAECYHGDSALLHPYFLLDACNKTLMRMFYLPAWVHTGSKIVLRKPLRVGDRIEIRAVPIDKWERKGHQFIKLYIAMWKDSELAVEVEHSAIFQLAGP